MKRLVTLHGNTLQDILKKQALRTKETRYVHRLHCVLLVDQGHGCAEVAHWFGETPRTIQRWVRAYTQAGADALCDDARTGRPSRLTRSQLDALRSYLSRPPSEAGYDRDNWDSNLVQNYLAEKINVRFSVRQCQRLLKSMRPHGSSPPTRRGNLTGHKA